jgi:hypothetical protein
MHEGNSKRRDYDEGNTYLYIIKAIEFSSEGNSFVLE